MTDVEQEFPVDWQAKGDSNVDIVRDVFGIGSKIHRTFWELSVSPRLTRRVSIGAGMMLVMVAVLMMTQYLNPQMVLDTCSVYQPDRESCLPISTR